MADIEVAALGIKKVGDVIIDNSPPCEMGCPEKSFKRCVYKYRYICGKEESAGCHKRYCRKHEFVHQEKYLLVGHVFSVRYTCCEECEEILLINIKKA